MAERRRQAVDAATYLEATTALSTSVYGFHGGTSGRNGNAAESRNLRGTFGRAEPSLLSQMSDMVTQGGKKLETR